MTLVSFAALTLYGARLVADEPMTVAGLPWETDYAQATEIAKSEHRQLLIYFFEEGENTAREAFEAKSLADAEVQKLLGRYVRLRLPSSYMISVSGVDTQVLRHPAFAEMLGRQGLAIVDYATNKEELYGRVVSAFPFTRGYYYQPATVRVILDLPPGTLTQRTLIFAVRTHPEHPQSVDGAFNLILAEEAARHSRHQAAIHVQGHHNWESRFHQINARLADGASAQEVCAESWPGQSLVDAARECVDSWRQSPGHWSAVRSRHSLFGFDMKRGSNGIWYATGIFANLRR